MAKKVFIGVGHGGNDPGAVANGFNEKDINLVIALKCRDELERHGVTVLMSRTKDENDTLNDEIKECNAFAPDLAIDLHINASGSGKGDGVEAYYHIGGGLSKTLAENVISEVVKVGQNSRGVKTRTLANGRDYYGFIRETIAPAVIVEYAFIDNATDIAIIDTKEEQQAMGVSTAKAVLKTLGITYKAASAATNKSKTVAINGINITRATGLLVLYAGKSSTNTNIYGTEVAFDSTGVAINAPVYGKGNMTIPAGGFVLSGHGAKATWLLENIRKGDKITINITV